ncbi:hypothetical protein, partial [Microbacterium sp. NPDC055665]
MPGTFADLGAQAVFMSTDGLSTPGGDAVTARLAPTAAAYPAGCFTDAVTGDVMPCGSTTARLVFSQPLINPVIATNGGSGGLTGVAGNPICFVTLQGVTFTQVNGQTPQTGQIEPTALHANALWDPSTLSLTGSAPSIIDPDGECLAENVDYSALSGTSYFQINGVVSSIDIATPLVNTMLRNTGEPHTGNVAPSISGVPISVRSAFADLSIEKSGPAVVEPGGTLDWTLTLTVPDTGANSNGLIIRDAVPAEVINPQLVSPFPFCELVGHDLECVLSPAVGGTPTEWLTVPTASPLVSQLTGGDVNTPVPPAAGNYIVLPIELTGTAPSAPGTTIQNVATVAGVDIDPDPTNNVSEWDTAVENTESNAAASAAADANGNPAAVAAGNADASTQASAAADVT